MNRPFIVILLLLAASSVQAFPKPVKDTVNRPELVRPGADGIIHLRAKAAYAIGPKIKYMPEWDAFGWFNAQDRVEWDAEVTRAGKYDVILEWSAEGSVVGNPYMFGVQGGRFLKGKIETTGSWEVFKAMKVGTIRLRKGKQRFVFKPDPELKKGGLLDLRTVRLEPVK